MRKHLFPLFSFLLFACACPLVAQVNVATADQLAAVASQSATEDFEGQTITLTADIILPNDAWTPIGTKDNPFKGTFNGNGHLIKGLLKFDETTTDGAGIFGYVGKGAVIENLGVSGTVVAPNRRRVGAIAGVCDGTIRKCWSMAEIAVSGNVVGGLVGELTSNAKIEDSYHAGLVLNGADTIGGVIGRNKGGDLLRVFNVGYAKNGNAIVGHSVSGSYNECYFDRKLYWQKSGVDGDEITPIDVTEEMFSIFAGNSTWVHSESRYPILAAFDISNAAKLSAAPMFIDKNSMDPVNHANDLTVAFTVSTEGGITWACQDKDDEQWIKINGDKVDVVRPCAPTDVLVDSKLGNETRVVYMSPRRVEDLLAGKFYSYDPETGEKEGLIGLCFNSKWLVNEYSEMDLAEQGWIGDGDYTYKVERYEITDNPADTVLLETMLIPSSTEDYENWYDTCHFPTNVAGHFLIRSFVHDNGCVTDWIENKSGVEYVVFGEFIPGMIETKKDTFLLETSPILVSSTGSEASIGGEDPVTYQWYVTVGGTMMLLPGQTGVELTNYPITEPGIYKFTRSTSDANCYTPPQILDLLGVYTVYVFDAFDAGEITNNDDRVFCTLAEAKAFVVNATAATGGTGKLNYRWYMDDEIISGATGQNLSLSSVDIAAGNTYIFRREAWDGTSYTEWTKTDYTQKVTIKKELKPGAIQDADLEKICFDNTLTSVTVHISEKTPAEGESGLEYRWVRKPDNKVVGTSKELNYTVYRSDNLQGTYSYVRYVANPGCQEFKSDGEVKQYYGSATSRDVVTTVCESDMPYTMTVGGQTHTFNSATEEWTVADESGECPAYTVYKLNVVTAPAFSIADEVSWCQTSSTMTIYFEQTAGLSDYFRITYSEDLARYMGAPDTTGIITVSGTIYFEHMPSLGEGDLYLYVQIGFTNGSGAGCYSSKHMMRLYPSLGGYVYSKYDRVVFVDNNPDNGALDVDNKLEFVSYQWYKNGLAQDGATEQYYHEGGTTLHGVFYCLLKDTKGNTYRTCDIKLPAEGASAAPQNSAVYPVPVAAGELLTIEAEGTAQIISFTGECVSRLEHVEGKTTLNAPRITGIYYVQITAADGTMEMHKLIVK